MERLEKRRVRLEGRDATRPRPASRRTGFWPRTRATDRLWRQTVELVRCYMREWFGWVGGLCGWRARGDRLRDGLRRQTGRKHSRRSPGPVRTRRRRRDRVARW